MRCVSYALLVEIGFRRTQRRKVRLPTGSLVVPRRCSSRLVDNARSVDGAKDEERTREAPAGGAWANGGRQPKCPSRTTPCAHPRLPHWGRCAQPSRRSRRSRRPPVSVIPSTRPFMIGKDGPPDGSSRFRVRTGGIQDWVPGREKRTTVIEVGPDGAGSPTRTPGVDGALRVSCRVVARMARSQTACERSPSQGGRALLPPGRRSPKGRRGADQERHARQPGRDRASTSTSIYRYISQASSR